MGTLVAGAVVLLAVSAAIITIIRDKKSGKGSCGGDCGHCKGCH